MAKKPTTKKTGSYKGKSDKLGYGGRAQQLKDKGVPGAVIGAIARSKGAAPVVLTITVNEVSDG
jgi:hypothetical protein